MFIEEQWRTWDAVVVGIRETEQSQRGQPAGRDSMRILGIEQFFFRESPPVTALGTASGRKDNGRSGGIGVQSHEGAGLTLWVSWAGRAETKFNHHLRDMFRDQVSVRDQARQLGTALPLTQDVSLPTTSGFTSYNPRFLRVVLENARRSQFVELCLHPSQSLAGVQN